MKELKITLKDGSVRTGTLDQPFIRNTNVHDIESLEWRKKEPYKPGFAWTPKPVGPKWPLMNK